MKITFLGTGTSVGIPVIGCECHVCHSTDLRNRRRRAALLVESENFHLLIDTPPDLREQALEYRIKRVDAVLLTHAHADHIFGFDDLRRFNTLQRSTIPIYGAADTIADMKRIFSYVLQPPEPGVFRPKIMFTAIAACRPLEHGPLRITPFNVEHGNMTTLGYRIDDQNGCSLAYAPDCHGFSENDVACLGGLDLMILDALRDRPHISHLTLEDSIAWLQRIGARRSYITHLCHDLDHETAARRLPAGIHAPWDGLTLRWGERNNI